MTKRSLFLTITAGLLISLVFTAPSQAGFITKVSIDNNTGIAVNDLETTWVGTGGNIINSVLTAPPGTSAVSGRTIVFTFTNPLANGGNVMFDFQSNERPLGLDSGSWSFKTPTGITFTTPVDTTRDKFKFQTSVIPEPNSLYLLGIGLAGFYTFRRFFKRTAFA
jgi:PEP-CTERM motif